MCAGCTSANSSDISKMNCKVVDLAPGDVLYMPKGVVHFAEATCNTTSAHVTYGLTGQLSYFDLAMSTCQLKLPTNDCFLLANAWHSVQFQPEVLSLHRQFPIWLYAKPGSVSAAGRKALDVFLARSPTLVTLEHALIPNDYLEASAHARIVEMLHLIPNITLSGHLKLEMTNERTRRRSTPWTKVNCMEKNTCTCYGW